MEDGGEVLQAGSCFVCYAAFDWLAGGGEGDLAGDVEGVACAYGLGLWCAMVADGSRVIMMMMTMVRVVACGKNFRRCFNVRMVLTVDTLCLCVPSPSSCL